MNNQKRVPEFHNLQVSTFAMGLGVTKEGIIHYMSTISTGPALKSIWASLVSNEDSAEIHCDYYHLTSMAGASGLKTIYAPIPNSTDLQVGRYQHLIIHGTDNAMLIAAHPDGARYTNLHEPTDLDARAALLHFQMPNILARFIGVLNQRTNVPVIDQWGQAVWDAAQDVVSEDKDSEGNPIQNKAITPLRCVGDCVGGWIINIDFNWLNLVQELLEVNAIDFPSHPL